MNDEMSDKICEERIIREIISDKIIGLSITEIVNLTGLSRSSVRINLARLEGAGKVNARKIGMAKVYILKENISGTKPTIKFNTETHSSNREHTFES
jgi:predicted transcriptional regulator